jgi:hypothetical protein
MKREMSDPAGRIRAKQLAEELNASWDKPTATKSPRLPAEPQTPERDAEKSKGDPVSAGAPTR